MNPSYLLDTCAWLDAFSAPEQLKPSIRKLLGAQSVVYLAAISTIEVARKEAAGQLIFGMPLATWFERAMPEHHIKVIDVSPTIAIDATRLPQWEHRDPADQIIVATARVHNLTILTSDQKILRYPHVKSQATRK